MSGSCYIVPCNSEQPPARDDSLPVQGERGNAMLKQGPNRVRTGDAAMEYETIGFEISPTTYKVELIFMVDDSEISKICDSLFNGCHT